MWPLATPNANPGAVSSEDFTAQIFFAPANSGPSRVSARFEPARDRSFAPGLGLWRRFWGGLVNADTMDGRAASADRQRGTR